MRGKIHTKTTLTVAPHHQLLARVVRSFSVARVEELCAPDGRAAQRAVQQLTVLPRLFTFSPRTPTVRISLPAHSSLGPAWGDMPRNAPSG